MSDRIFRLCEDVRNMLLVTPKVKEQLFLLPDEIVKEVSDVLDRNERRLLRNLRDEIERYL